jgi:hypothetical protein
MSAAGRVSISRTSELHVGHHDVTAMLQPIGYDDIVTS